MNLDFVKTPFTNNPSMVRHEGIAFNKNSNDFYVKKKKNELRLHGNFLYGESKLSIARGLKNEVANYIEAESNFSLEDLTLTIEEDFAVMYKGHMELVSVCFPSGWVPVKKIGQKLSSIHAPVADNDQLLQSSEKLSIYMTKQSIKRWVWTVTTCSELSNFPGFKQPEADRLDDLYFRVETQTSVPLGVDTSLFFIKVEVVPLQKVWDEKILDSINSMSENILNYKDLKQIKKLLNTIKV